MKKVVIAISGILVIAAIVLLNLSPDALSMIILGVMCVVIAMGFVLGLLPMIRFSFGLKHGRDSIHTALDVQSTENWLAVIQVERLFQQKTLDRIFSEYKQKIDQQKEDNEILNDVEDYISEDMLGLRSWQGLVQQIPGILTGLGILGTFIGLITGITAIGFSSIEATVESITILLKGIQMAFYTSIAGVILSILFNILYRMIWNVMLREHGMFIDTFHKLVIPPVEEQIRVNDRKDMRKILNRLDRIPKNPGYSMSNSAISDSNSKDEQMLMPQIMDGLKRGEFIFHLQPVIDLNSRKIISAEALVRWNHPTLGVLSPGAFVPVLERNGFITKLDMYIWEEVCGMVRSWIDAGIRPVPVSINISKTDLMALDVPKFFVQMLEKYHIPPRALELEVTKRAYVENPAATNNVVKDLRQLGFKVTMDGFEGDFISVNMLENTEVDCLKLDLRFMREQELEQNIDTIFEQAKKLHIEVIASGIENTEQVTNLKAAGCVAGQGYYFQKPLTIKDFEISCTQG